MPTEIDIELRLPNFPQTVSSEMGKQFGVDLVDLETVVHASPKNIETKRFDEAIKNFLQSLTVFAPDIKETKGTLRLGIFYDLEETVVFPLRLSAETVQMLGGLNLSIDSTGYPCRDKTEVN